MSPLVGSCGFVRKEVSVHARSGYQNIPSREPLYERYKKQLCPLYGRVPLNNNTKEVCK